MITTTVVFRVGSDRKTIKTMFLADVPLADLPGRIAERGLQAPHQFPASAVHIASVTRRSLT